MSTTSYHYTSPSFVNQRKSWGLLGRYVAVRWLRFSSNSVVRLMLSLSLTSKFSLGVFSWSI